MMKKLQKLGKALMLPVAALPICGILMGLGYAIAPGVMGVPGAATSGALYNIGFLLIKAGGALIDNMAWLFVIGVAVGLADDKDGTSALAGLVSWLMMTNLLSTGVVTTLMPAIADDPVKTLAFDKIQNVFIAIIAGIIGSACYNRFKNAKLPDWLAFFSGKRCVAIVTGLVSILVSVVLLFVWPIIFGALVSVGEAIIGMDGIGAGIYAFLNRLLIPTGLHHALNNVFWFDTIGLGDLSHYWAGDVSGQNGVTWSLGMYMSGFFPCMMFGVFGAALAMIKTAKNKKAAIVWFCPLRSAHSSAALPSRLSSASCSCASRCISFTRLCTASSPSSPTTSASAQASASPQARPTSYSRPSCRRRTTP